MNRNMELRKLPTEALCKVVDILEVNSDWKKLMSIIPKNLHSEEFEPKYSKEHIRLIEEHAQATHQTCTDLFMVNWSTTGKLRPTLGTLKDILIKAQLYRAADEVAIMLNEPIPERPNYGLAESFPIIFTQKTYDSAEVRPQDKSTAVKSNTGQKHNESTGQMECLSDNKTCSHELMGPVKSAPDLLELPKEQHTEESMNIPDLSALLVD